jgi:hypothetical protein
MVAIHLHVAIVGWVLLMIAGVSRRLLPMFLLSHGVNPRLSSVSVGLLALGLPVLVWGLATRLDMAAWAGLLLLEGGVVAFIAQGVRHLLARKRPVLDAGLRHVRAGLVLLAAAAALAPFVLRSGALHPRLAITYVFTGLVGGVGVIVIGLQYKVVPFLAWVARYRDRMGREQVPVVAQLTSPRAGRAGLWLAVAGVAMLDGGVALAREHVAHVGAALFLLATLTFAAQLRRAAWGRIA